MEFVAAQLWGAPPDGTPMCRQRGCAPLCASGGAPHRVAARGGAEGDQLTAIHSLRVGRVGESWIFNFAGELGDCTKEKFTLAMEVQNTE